MLGNVYKTESRRINFPRMAYMLQVGWVMRGGWGVLVERGGEGGDAGPILQSCVQQARGAVGQSEEGGGWQAREGGRLVQVPRGSAPVAWHLKPDAMLTGLHASPCSPSPAAWPRML